MKNRVAEGHEVDLGIVGGGQLARMTAERAAKLGLTTAVLDPSLDCAARSLAQRHVCAGFDDAAGLEELVKISRVTTFDIELADTVELMRLEEAGHTILPRPALLAIIQDKLLQREFLAKHGLPVPRFADLPDATLPAMIQFGFPLVQKARRGGYDGRGVAVLQSDADYQNCLQSPSMVEDKVDINREFAALVVRSRSGKIASYPITELMPDPKSHVLDSLVFPARVEPSVDRDARELAHQAIEALDGVGIFAVELFLDTSDKLWINEISPRPHNAGHVTLEAAATCQFEQHLRAILDLPLGDTESVAPAAMVNLLGPTDVRGEFKLEGLNEALEIPGARIHLYGKLQTWPGRKLGHLTVVDPDAEVALKRARQARELLRFVSTQEQAA